MLDSGYYVSKPLRMLILWVGRVHGPDQLSSTEKIDKIFSNSIVNCKNGNYYKHKVSSVHNIHVYIISPVQKSPMLSPVPGHPLNDVCLANR